MIRRYLEHTQRLNLERALFRSLMAMAEDSADTTERMSYLTMARDIVRRPEPPKSK